MAENIRRLGPEYVLLKGGHIPFTGDGHASQNEDDERYILNILATKAGNLEVRTAYFKSKNTHGTGCSLASAIASNIASATDDLDDAAVLRAVKSATRYVEAGIVTSKELGKGNGPINHFHSTYTLPFSP